MNSIGMKRAALAAVYRQYRRVKAAIDNRDQAAWVVAVSELERSVKELEGV